MIGLARRALNGETEKSPLVVQEVLQNSPAWVEKLHQNMELNDHPRLHPV